MSDDEMHVVWDDIMGSSDDKPDLKDGDIIAVEKGDGAGTYIVSQVEEKDEHIIIESEV